MVAIQAMWRLPHLFRFFKRSFVMRILCVALLALASAIFVAAGLAIFLNESHEVFATRANLGGAVVLAVASMLSGSAGRPKRLMRPSFVRDCWDGTLLVPPLGCIVVFGFGILREDFILISASIGAGAALAALRLMLVPPAFDPKADQDESLTAVASAVQARGTGVPSAPPQAPGSSEEMSTVIRMNGDDEVDLTAIAKSVTDGQPSDVDLADEIFSAVPPSEEQAKVSEEKRVTLTPSSRQGRPFERAIRSNCNNTKNMYNNK